MQFNSACFRNCEAEDCPSSYVLETLIEFDNELAGMPMHLTAPTLGILILTTKSSVQSHAIRPKAPLASMRRVNR